DEPQALRERFHRAHEQAYGYSDPEVEVELVTLRATATVPGPDIDPTAAGEATRTTRQAIFDGEPHEATVLRGEPPPRTKLEGPAIVELPEATLAVPPGWGGEVLQDGTIRIERWTR